MNKKLKEILKGSFYFWLIIGLVLLILAANPSFNVPTLNTTNVLTNNTNVNISLSIVHNDATALYNITTWYENNISLLVLNMPFTTNTNDVKDYSGYNNNGTISGATWQRYLNEDNNSLVLLMPFDEDNSTNAIDKSDYKNNGVLSGAFLNTSCVVGTCYSFNGSNSNSFINITSLVNLQITQELWKKNSTDINWIHLVNSSGQLFRNGVAVNNASDRLPISNGTNSVRIGIFNNEEYFNGSIDNVRIYKKVLTSDEISDHYEKYKLYYSPSFKFDGVNDAISISDSASLISSKDAITVTAWINAQGNGENSQGRILQKNSGAANLEFTLTGSSTLPTKLYFQTANIFNTTPNNVITANKWHFVVGTYDRKLSTNNLRIYVDGNLQAVTNGTSEITDSTASLFIGATGLGVNSRQWNGSIANVRIYNRSLSANQIYELYNSYNTSALGKLVSEETTAGRTYKAQVYVANSSDLGISDNTSEILIIDDFAYFNQSNHPFINSTLGFNRTTEDLQITFVPRKNDTIILNYSVEVFKNNVSSFTINNIYARNNTLTVFTIDKANISVGQTWKAQVGLKTNYTLTAYSNTSELLILENNTPVITLNYPLEGTQFTASIITFRYEANDDSSISQCQLFIDNILLKTNTTITKNVEDSYTNTTLTSTSHKWYVNCLDSQNIQVNSTIITFLIDLPVSEPRGGNPSVPIEEIKEEVKEIIEDIRAATPDEIKSFVTEKNVYFYLLGTLFIFLGIYPRMKKKKISFAPLFFGMLIIILTYKPEYINLAKDFIGRMGVNITTGIMIIAVSILSIILVYQGIKKNLSLAK